MKLTGEQRERAREFQALMSMPGWDTLIKLADAEVERSMRSQDQIPAEKMNINHVCEERGYRKGIRWLIQQSRTIGEIG